MADDLSTGVDRSPINTLERRNSLEKHLQTRPEPQDLKDRHILLDTNAAPYAPRRMVFGPGLRANTGTEHSKLRNKNWSAKKLQIASRSS